MPFLYGGFVFRRVVLKLLQRLDAALVRFSRVFGTSINRPILQQFTLIFAFGVIQFIAFSADSRIAFVALWIGYIGVISVGRAWVNNEKLRTSIARKLSDSDPDELPDLRISALLSALQLLILIPLLLRTSDSLFHLYKVPEDASMVDWLLLGVDLLFKSILDWSEVYGIQLSSIKLDSLNGRHLIMLLLLTIDFILIQGLLRLFEIRRTINEGVAAAIRDPEMAYRLGQRAVPRLLQLLDQSDLQTAERIHVVEALAVLKVRRASSALIRLFEDDEMHTTAVAAMVNIGWNAPLLASLKNESEIVKRGAIIALGRIGSPEATLYLAKEMANNNSELREKIIRAITRIEINSTPYLMRALGDESVPVRLAAMQGLAMDTSEELMQILVEMISDSEPDIRLAVVDALQRFSDGRVVGPLAAALDDTDERVSRQAQRSLNHLESVVSSRGGSSDQ